MVRHLPTVPRRESRFQTLAERPASGFFDNYADLLLTPANEAWKDDHRMEIDRLVLRDVLYRDDKALDLTQSLRYRWCLKPTAQGEKGQVKHR